MDIADFSSLWQPYAKHVIRTIVQRHVSVEALYSCELKLSKYKSNAKDGDASPPPLFEFLGYGASEQEAIHSARCNALFHLSSAPSGDANFSETKQEASRDVALTSSSASSSPPSQNPPNWWNTKGQFGWSFARGAASSSTSSSPTVASSVPVVEKPRISSVAISAPVTTKSSTSTSTVVASPPTTPSPAEATTDLAAWCSAVHHYLGSIPTPKVLFDDSDTSNSNCISLLNDLKNIGAVLELTFTLGTSSNPTPLFWYWAKCNLGHNGNRRIQAVGRVCRSKKQAKGTASSALLFRIYELYTSYKTK